jgi:hypothetical protein
VSGGSGLINGQNNPVLHSREVTVCWETLSTRQYTDGDGDLVFETSPMLVIRDAPGQRAFDVETAELVCFVAKVGEFV